MRSKLIVMLCLTIPLALVGCGGTGGGVGAAGKVPGTYDADGGQTEVVGTLVYRDLEGGFWAVADAASATDAEMAPNLAVVITEDADLSASLEELSGKYVSAVGTLDDGMSIFMAGPLLYVTSVQESAPPAE